MRTTRKSSGQRSGGPATPKKVRSAIAAFAAAPTQPSEGCRAKSTTSPATNSTSAEARSVPEILEAMPIEQLPKSDCRRRRGPSTLERRPYSVEAVANWVAAQ